MVPAEGTAAPGHLTCGSKRAVSNIVVPVVKVCSGKPKSLPPAVPPDDGDTDVKAMCKEFEPSSFLQFRLNKSIFPKLIFYIKMISNICLSIRSSLVAQWQRIHLPARRHGFDPWVRKIPWKRKWQPIPVFLPGESHGQRSLVSYSPWGCKRVRHD